MKVAFVASSTPLAQRALADLTDRYGQTSVAQADIVVALGGDGKVLKTLYDLFDADKPVFAMRRTESVGFLCNEFMVDGLEERLAAAQSVELNPLCVQARTADGRTEMATAINEVSFIRETPQSARLRISIDGVERIGNFSGDGILLATPAGSTAYNHSCGGPIMPLDANTLVITAISGFRPRGWSYAVLPQNAVLEVEVLEIEKRPVRIEAGASIINNVAGSKVWLDRAKRLNLLFDPDQHLSERIVREQFLLV